MPRAAQRPSGGTSAQAQPESRSGTIIADRYRLERPIGTGGMATIWEATHLALKRPVAVKLIDIAGPHTAKMRERFLREARVAAAVRHRNVVDISDFGTSADGSPFMVMELLVGVSLASRITSGSPMNVAETVRIMARVLSGLAAVHDAGIVHRDLKPENVFLVEDADGSFPKLLDFGVSRAMDPLGELQSVLPTTDNAIVGTPQYMSPEQARGLSGIDHRSDLWSAGVMIYELLTGVLPFDADAVGDVIIKIATSDPPSLVSLRPDLAGPLERLIEKAMQRDPGDRFQSAREMRAALLAAVAQTANAMRDGSAAVASRGEVPTLAELPPTDAGELLDAVGDAYEPGDSGVLDLSEQAIDDPEPRPGPLALPPPAKVPAGGEAAERVFSERERPPRSPRGLLVAALALLVLVAAGAAGAIALGSEPDEMRVVEMPRATASEPAPTVSVELRGVPEGASVTVDGEARTLPLTLARSDASHIIEVRGAAGASWGTTHRATSDGAYDVSLQPREEPSAGPVRAVQAARPPPVSRDRRRVRARGAAPARAEGLLRDPGF